jgi:lysyl-tRNA synthetase, class II
MVDSDEDSDVNEQIAQRRAKLAQLRGEGNPFPNDFRRNIVAGELHAEYDGKDPAALEAVAVRVKVAGRIMTRRVMGKASFCHLQDMSGQIQLYLQRDALGSTYEDFKRWDIGDIIGAEGVLFKTKTGELSVKIDTARLLTKALRPLPDKFHGLVDQEARYRQRYLDLIMSDVARRTFRTRIGIVN